MNKALLLLMIMLLSVLTLAEPAAEIDLAKLYKKVGLQFSYPQSCCVTEDSVGPDARVKFFSLPVPHIREYLSLSQVEQPTIIISQVAVEDLTEAAPVFQLVERTLEFGPE